MCDNVGFQINAGFEEGGECTRVVQRGEFVRLNDGGVALWHAVGGARAAVG